MLGKKSEVLQEGQEIILFHLLVTMVWYREEDQIFLAETPLPIYLAKIQCATTATTLGTLQGKNCQIKKNDKCCSNNCK